MKRLAFALLVLGMGAVSFGALLPDFTKLIVLKGTCTDTVHYVLNNAVPDTAAAVARRAVLGVDAIELAAKPKVYYFLVVEVKYTPEIVAGKWTGEGTLGALDFWPLGALEYGIGRHDANGVWQPKLAYAYDIGASDPFWIGFSYWYWPKAKVRTGDVSILSVDAAGTFEGNSRDGVGDLVYSAKLITNKVTGESWYEPSITSLTISYAQVMQQWVGTPAAWKDVQIGAGKLVFKPDTKMTTTANLTDATGANIGLAQVSIAIRDLLVKGKYPAVTPDLDPFDYHP